MPTLFRGLKDRDKEIVRLLGEFVRCESPSHDKAAVDRMGKIVASEWQRRGARVRVLRQVQAGNHVRAEVWLGEGRPSGRILVLGHLDTVYPLGTLAKMPFRIAKQRAWGPGTFDMKAGLVLALFAVDALRAAGLRPRKRLVFFWNSDEEIGSQTSRGEIEREARQSDAVLVLEPAYGRDGCLKTARKGVGTAELVVSGRSAHAGIDPSAGVNAVHEMALQIARLMKMNDRRRGITVQTTVVAGGTASNVVPEHARAKIDIRYSHLADAPKIDRRLQSLRPILDGARIEMRGGVNRPPLERTHGVVKLFQHARALMKEMRVPLDEASTGGGSDGNFTSALGVPTLDGLGAVGNGAHSIDEHVLIRSLPERAALLAGLLATL
ncbi:MAG TPA: M20 family metallopeptidase [Candidatus Acidoferrales bacterium]|jgi:glutamate carboxypeptidase|nr:M20 family metallopeptidase [Candidatus Acidoferrales bacterium]